MKRYSKDEDKVILKHVKENSSNLTTAFKNAGLELDRSPRAIAQRWYNKLSKSNDVCFMCVGHRKTTLNRKSVRVETTKNTIKNNESLFNKILKFFGL